MVFAGSTGFISQWYTSGDTKSASKNCLLTLRSGCLCESAVFGLVSTASLPFHFSQQCTHQCSWATMHQGLHASMLMSCSEGGE